MGRCVGMRQLTRPRDGSVNIYSNPGIRRTIRVMIYARIACIEDARTTEFPLILRGRLEIPRFSRHDETRTRRVHEKRTRDGSRECPT